MKREKRTSEWKYVREKDKAENKLLAEERENKRSEENGTKREKEKRKNRKQQKSRNYYILLNPEIIHIYYIKIQKKTRNLNWKLNFLFEKWIRKCQ